jgi:hypothetical protein
MRTLRLDDLFSPGDFTTAMYFTLATRRNYTEEPRSSKMDRVFSVIGWI